MFTPQNNDIFICSKVHTIDCHVILWNGNVLLEG